MLHDGELPQNFAGPVPLEVRVNIPPGRFATDVKQKRAMSFKNSDFGLTHEKRTARGIQC